MAARGTLSPDVRKALAGHADTYTKAHVHRNRHQLGRAIAAIRLLKQKHPDVVVRGRQTQAAIVAGPATRWATQALKPIHRAISVNELIAVGTAAWAAEGKAAKKARVVKAGRDDVVRRIADNLRTKVEAIPQSGAVAGYLGLAEAASTEAGQMTLDNLGINQTWRWTGIRDVTPDLFQARGSKIIQGMYGQHVDRLANIAARATNPSAALSIGQVRAQINEEWGGMEAYQVDRIARTETAVMWETTAANTYTLNGIQFKEWLDAGAEDSLCLDNVADGVIPMADAFSSGDTEPPAHPNCVCDLLPVLTNADGSNWLPPAEPFTGNVDGMPLVAAPVPGEGAVGELLSPVGDAPIPTSPLSSVELGAQEITQADARQWAADQGYGKWAEDLTPEERDAVREYTRFTRVGRFLRGGGLEGDAEPELARAVRGVDAALAKAPRLGRTMRVFRIVDEEFAPTVGETVPDPSYVSTTLSRDWVDGQEWAANQRQMEIIVPEGTRGGYVGYGASYTDPAVDGRIALGDFPNQYEYILPRGGSMQVVEVREDGTIVARFIPPEPEVTTTIEERGVRVAVKLEDAAGREAGNLDLVKVKGGDLRVTNVNVDDAWQHKGLATRMVEDAHAANPDAVIMHDATSMTPEGRAWAESLPREWNRVYDPAAPGVDIRDAQEAFRVAHDVPSFGFNGAAVDDGVDAAVRRTYASVERRFPDVASRWDGTFNVGDNAAESVQHGAADAVKEWTCSISVSDNLMRRLADGDPQAQKVLAHELAHSFSIGSGDPVVYAANRGMEEGVVEGWANAHYGGEGVRAVYDEFAAPLEQARAELGMTETDFYDSLIRQPLSERRAYLEDLVGHPVDMPYGGARGGVLAEPFPKGEAPWFAGRDAAPRWNNMLKITKMRASQVPEGFDYGNGVRDAVRFVDYTPEDFPLGQPAVFQGDHVIVDRAMWDRMAVARRVDLLANNAVGEAVNADVLHGTGDVKKFVDLMEKFQVPGTPSGAPFEYSFKAALARTPGNADLMPAYGDAENMSIEDLWRETSRKVLNGTDDMETQAARDIADMSRSSMTRLGFQTNRTARLQRARIEEYLANIVEPTPVVPALGRDAAAKTFQDVVDEAVNIRDDGLIGKGINDPHWGMVQGPDGTEVKVVLKNPAYGSSGYGTGVDHERGAKVIADWFDGVNVPESGTRTTSYGNGLVSEAALNPDGTVAPTARVFEEERYPYLSPEQQGAYHDAVAPQLKRQKLLDYLIGNHDRHMSNYLIQTVLKEDGTETYRVVSIDQEVFAPTGFHGGDPATVARMITQDDAASLQGMIDDPALADWYQPDELKGLRGRAQSLLDAYTGQGNPLPEPARIYRVPVGPQDPNWAAPLAKAPVELGDAIDKGINGAHFAKVDLGGGNMADVVVKPNHAENVLAHELFAPDVNEVGGFDIKMPQLAARDLREIDLEAAGRAGTMGQDYGLIQARIPDVINGGDYRNLAPREIQDIKDIVDAQRRRINLFDRVIGNGDRNAGNWMVNPKNGDVWAIDHGYAFNDGKDVEAFGEGFGHTIFPNGEEGWADVNLTNEEHDILQRVFDDLNDPAGTMRQLYETTPAEKHELDAMQARIEKMLENGTIDGSVPPPIVEAKPIINPAIDPKFDERLATGQLKVGAKVGVNSVNDVKFGRIDGLGKDGFQVVVKTRGGYGEEYFGAEKELGAQIINDQLGEVGANLPRVVVRNAGSGNEQIVVARIQDAFTYDGLGGGGGYDPLRGVPEEDLRGMQLLDNLLGNTDRHMGNVMFAKDETGQYRLFAIDHGLTFGRGATEASGQVANAITRANGGNFVVELTSQERESLRIMLDNWPKTRIKLIDAGIDTVPARAGGIPPIEQVRLRAQAMYDQNRLLGWTQAW